MSMRRTALALLLVMAELPCLLSGAPLGTDPIAWSEPVPEWCEGPVRYALTSQEVREFKSLKSPAERSAFIARFWAARDPDPYVPGNVAEETFWKRVADADQLFTATTIAGWRTDRGKVYIVLGPPDEITSYNMPDPLARRPEAGSRDRSASGTAWRRGMAVPQPAPTPGGRFPGLHLRA